MQTAAAPLSGRAPATAVCEVAHTSQRATRTLEITKGAGEADVIQDSDVRPITSIPMRHAANFGQNENLVSVGPDLKCIDSHRSSARESRAKSGNIEAKQVPSRLDYGGFSH